MATKAGLKGFKVISYHNMHSFAIFFSQFPSAVKETNGNMPQKTEVKLTGSSNTYNAPTTTSTKELNGNAFILNEGYIKTPNADKTAWETKYAKLSPKWLNFYRNPTDPIPIATLDLCPSQGYGRLVTEPTDTDHPPAANNGGDTSLIFKIEIYASCWPQNTQLLMALNQSDKEKWHGALGTVLQQTDQPYKGQTVVTLTPDLDVNCFSGDPKLLGTEQGLFSWRNDKADLLHIAGPRKVYQITAVPSENLLLMIAESNRILIQCDLNVSNSLALTKQFSNPTLPFCRIPASDLDGFLLFRCSDFAERCFMCAATAKQVLILRYNVLERDFRPLRILDTAEPTSCAHFARHSLLVGANKFFEVDLGTLQADEFLDVCDERLGPVVHCYRRNSFPLAIVCTGNSPVEYLLCFSEFGVFSDEFGRSCRDVTIQWSRSPVAFVFYAPYLYVVQFGGVEVIRVDALSDNVAVSGDGFKLDLVNPRFLGAYRKGVAVAVGDEVVLVEGRFLDKDNVSLSSYAETRTTQEDRFSFTTSMVESLDGLSASDTETTDLDCKRKVKFTDL